MAPKKPAKKPAKKKYKGPGFLVSIGMAGSNYPGKKAVMASWNSRMNRIKAGGK